MPSSICSFADTDFPLPVLVFVLHIPLFFFIVQPPPCSTLFPYTTLFRSILIVSALFGYLMAFIAGLCRLSNNIVLRKRSEEHTSELQSRGHLVCRLLLEKKKMEPGPPA